MENSNFKYKTEIELYITKGATMPELFEPKDKDSCRFVFDYDHPNNHLPAYITKPSRAISDFRKDSSTIGYALSCFDTEENAVKKFEDLKKVCRNIEQTIGNCLCRGIIEQNDGKITHIGSNGHFSLFEFCSCDLSSKFEIKRTLT